MFYGVKIRAQTWPFQALNALLLKPLADKESVMRRSIVLCQYSSLQVMLVVLQNEFVRVLIDVPNASVQWSTSITTNTTPNHESRTAHLVRGSQAIGNISLILFTPHKHASAVGN
jgi:hypothetical protein